MSAFERVTLGEVATLQAGVGFPLDLQGRSSGEYPVAKVGDISRVGRSSDAVLRSAEHFVTKEDLARLRVQPIPEGSVLFAKIGEAIRQNHRVIAGRPLLIDNNAMAAIPTARIDSRYLYRFLCTVDFYGLASSTTVPALRKSELTKVRVPLPPLAEQRRIAAILDKADALRAKRRAALAQLDTLAQSIFLDMFGDLASNRTRWSEVALSEICQVKGGKRLPKGAEYSTHPTPFRYIRVTDIKSGTVDELALVYLKPEVQAKISRYTVSAGDVIISIAGSIGLIAAVTQSLCGANLTENAAKLTPRVPGAYDAVFLAHLLQTKYVQEQIGARVGQVTIGKLALFRIEQLRVPLPPVHLQREFTMRTENVAALRVLHARSLKSLDRLFSSLQHHAFRGEL